MSGGGINEELEQLEDLATRARCMAWFLDGALDGVMFSKCDDACIQATELDREMISFAKLEVVITCDSLAELAKELHGRIRQMLQPKSASSH